MRGLFLPVPFFITSASHINVVCAQFRLCEVPMWPEIGGSASIDQKMVFSDYVSTCQVPAVFLSLGLKVSSSPRVMRLSEAKISTRRTIGDITRV